MVVFFTVVILLSGTTITLNSNGSTITEYTDEKLPIAMPSHQLHFTKDTSVLDTTISSTNSTISELLGEISANNIYHQIYELQNFSNRLLDSPSGEAATRHIAQELGTIPGLSVSCDPFFYNGHWNANVVGLLPGQNISDKRLFIVSAHHDSVECPGADDDGSGTAAVIEIARVMSRYRFQSTLVFVTFAAEEAGLIGSRMFAENCSRIGQKVGLDIQLDMIGYDNHGKCNVSVEAYPRSNWTFAQSQAIVSKHSLGLSLKPSTPSGRSDHASFDAYGYPAMLFIEEPLNPNYHCPTDTVDKLGMNFTRNITRLACALAAENAGIIPNGEGHVFLDRDTYSPGMQTAVRIFDENATGPLKAVLESSVEPYGENVTMVATAPGVFTGVIMTNIGSAIKGDGVLQVDHTDEISAVYADLFPPKSSRAVAPCKFRTISAYGLAVLPDMDSVTFSWQTDINATSEITLWSGSGTLANFTDSRMVKAHKIVVAGLQPDTVYHFDALSMDDYGNLALLDNKGKHFGFRTITGITSIPGNNCSYWVRQNASLPGGDNPQSDGFIASGFTYSSGPIVGALQFEILSFPPGAKITNASISLNGVRCLNTASGLRLWDVQILNTTVDSGFESHNYTYITTAMSDATLPPELTTSSVSPGKATRFYFNSPLLNSTLGVRIGKGKLSIRITNINDGCDNGLAWDSGSGGSSAGLVSAPRLRIGYTTNSDFEGPYVKYLNISPNPTDGAGLVNVTAVISDNKSKVIGAEWYWGTDPGIGKGTWFSPPHEGIMDNSTITVTVQINTSSYSPGNFKIHVRGKDSCGHWGPSASEVLQITPNPVPEDKWVIIPGIVLTVVAVISMRQTSSLRQYSTRKRPDIRP